MAAALKRRTEVTPPEPTEFETAYARYRDATAKHSALIAKIDGIRVAFSLRHNPGDETRVPQRLVDMAEPYRNRAGRRPEKLREELLETEEALTEFKPTFAQECELWAVARRAETDRIARELQPRQRAAIETIARGLELLSEGFAAEMALQAELRASAPLPTSSYLPDMTADIGIIGAVSRHESPAWRWAKRVRNMGVI